jgi:ABC-type phosphate transport system substrate-binding protein
LIKSRLGRVVGTAVAAVAVTGVMQVAGASAAPAPVRLTIVGGVSDTTQGVMGAVTSKFDSSSVAKSANVVATNVPPVPGKLGKIVPSDANCNGGHSITYIAGPNPGTNERTAPDSDAAGETALATSVTDGDSCTSIARAPLPDPTTDPAGTQAWAYAVDDLTWIRSSNTLSPPNLTMKEIEGVYDCKYLHWHQLGGKGNDMPTIGRYFPPEGSAAATFYSGVLGFDPYVLGGTMPAAPHRLWKRAARPASA